MTQCAEFLSLRTFGDVAGDEAEVITELGQDGWIEMNQDGRYILFGAVGVTSDYEVYDISTGDLVGAWPGDALRVLWRRSHLLL